MFTLMSKQSTLLQITNSFGGMNSVPVKHIFDGAVFADLCATDTVLVTLLSETLRTIVGEAALFRGDVTLTLVVGCTEEVLEACINQARSIDEASLTVLSDAIVQHVDNHVVEWEDVTKEIKDLKPKIKYSFNGVHITTKGRIKWLYEIAKDS